MAHQRRGSRGSWILSLHEMHTRHKGASSRLLSPDSRTGGQRSTGRRGEPRHRLRDRASALTRDRPVEPQPARSRTFSRSPRRIACWTPPRAHPSTGRDRFGSQARRAGRFMNWFGAQAARASSITSWPRLWRPSSSPSPAGAPGRWTAWPRRPRYAFRSRDRRIRRFDLGHDRVALHGGARDAALSRVPEGDPGQCQSGPRLDRHVRDGSRLSFGLLLWFHQCRAR